MILTAWFIEEKSINLSSVRLKTVGSLIDTALIIKRQVTTWGKNTGQHINTGQQYI